MPSDTAIQTDINIDKAFDICTKLQKLLQAGSFTEEQMPGAEFNINDLETALYDGLITTEADDKDQNARFVATKKGKRYLGL